MCTNCNKPELGDKIEAGLEKLGAKSCAGCKQRKSELNVLSRTYSRRGVLSAMAVAPFVLKNMALPLAYQSFGSTLPSEEANILGLLRTCNNEQWKGIENLGRSLEQTEMLAAVVAHQAHITPQRSMYKWLSVFTPNAAQQLPGWTLVSRVTGPKSYVIAVVGPTYTFLTDENALLLVAPASGTDLSGITSAAGYPGALSVDDKDAVTRELTAWQKLKRHFTSVTYANGPDPAPVVCCCLEKQCCCASGDCYADCGKIVCKCFAACPSFCIQSLCQSNRELNGCAFNVGCNTSCRWYNAPAEGGQCFTCLNCADVFRTCCGCLGNGCNP